MKHCFTKLLMAVNYFSLSFGFLLNLRWGTKKKKIASEERLITRHGRTHPHPNAPTSTKAKEDWRGPSCLASSRPFPNTCDYSHKASSIGDDKAESPGHYTKASLSTTVASCCQATFRRGSRDEGRGHKPFLIWQSKREFLHGGHRVWAERDWGPGSDSDGGEAFSLHGNRLTSTSHLVLLGLTLINFPNFLPTATYLNTQSSVLTIAMEQYEASGFILSFIMTMTLLRIILYFQPLSKERQW